MTWDLRYAGQAFELPVAAPADAGLAMLRERFEQAHGERYGYADPTGVLEIVNLRVDGHRGAQRPRRRPPPAAPCRRGARPATRDFDGRRVETARALAARPARASGSRGPPCSSSTEATVVVPPGWVAASDEHGAVLLDRERTR